MRRFLISFGLVVFIYGLGTGVALWFIGWAIGHLHLIP
jgi:hypothetical protein